MNGVDDDGNDSDDRYESLHTFLYIHLGASRHWEALYKNHIIIIS